MCQHSEEMSNQYEHMSVIQGYHIYLQQQLERYFRAAEKLITTMTILLWQLQMIPSLDMFFTPFLCHVTYFYGEEVQYHAPSQVFLSIPEIWCRVGKMFLVNFYLADT